jgi:hypothetical protein
LGLPFWKFISHQIYTVALLASMAWLSAAIVDQVIKGTVLGFLVSGFVYTFGVMIISLLLPSLFFMSRAELAKQLAQLRSTIKL